MGLGPKKELNAEMYAECQLTNNKKHFAPWFIM